jgi:hypothetical protein
LIGVLGLEQRGNIMKFRNLLAGDASWSDAVALGAERAAAAAAKAAASAG